ncbi:methionine adenosyltransferase [bacterium]|nr:methionine adenosyltransferase [bacterium]
MSEYLFSSESVTEGHPDKVCDQIADAILDDILAADPQARVACEVMANTGLVFIFGEITTRHYCDMEGIARQVLRRIGYRHPLGFAADSCAVLTAVKEQSSDISGAVNSSVEQRSGAGLDPFDEQGAGDQGIMFGYACGESEPFFPGTWMPLPILLAHRLAMRLAQVRHEGRLPLLGPDGKTQVTLRYAGGRPAGLQSVLISTQHSADYDYDQMRRDLLGEVLVPVLPAALLPGEDCAKLDFLCNPSGKFIKGGPEADSGLTGRKLIVDTYGGSARHGGGSFSGKDPSKVDRSANYFARYVAKQLVAAGAAERLELQISYAIGRARPMSFAVECFGSNHVPLEKIVSFLSSGEVFDFRPRAIIEKLELLKCAYGPTASYGHFGRTDLELPWERLDRVDAVKQALGL